ncbi:UDP-4-amino-4,6-dideoxy-N-acetyl-beta-L-altrosamine transaminase [Sulfitobacter pontiacus]|uniref:UDP-4-amino-4,6-dideoxy-N-acetyl-beta-L-altrosamine transaminase n=1 Tax=Sulfitobacter pontiacus TaxID=60137 RepID=A0A1H3DPP5_9RHOB|nr:UDP-4-amino-4,6-dideoxy-N-acetyl-beta-L-altrosamine transaminase [Sulfitobacter pontiacus]SDX67644.1 UDP-4-amino-4,6-dideoxy-N-acetyl-beta-L-altrosamine transaminase [Sulfitobacter pontiacus]|tara:strand:+ start:4762 stop:5910 length:1149 start_codon:yes stop_codon:yes gene_type:complete
MIPYGRQDISQNDIEAVTAVLRSDFLTQGPVVPSFEAAVAGWSGAKHGIAVNSATSALHIACLALDLGPGDRLWTSPITFVASANCGLYCGATVDFVDIDPATYNMSPERLEEKLSAAKRTGTLPKIIVPVHMCGQSCDMEAIGSLARAYGVAIIEDASHAIGGHWQGAPVGNCAHSDITVFSFHPVKIITTAEGGLATTNDPELAARMERLRSHGITRDPDLMTHAPDGPWYYQQIDLGLNYRMTEMQAALGLSQMDRLEQFVAHRHTLADRYDAALADLPLTTPWRHPNSHSACHLYIVTLDDPTRHREAFEALRSKGIGVNLHYIPVHLQPYYRNMGFSPGDFPLSEAYYSRAMSIPLFATMTEVQQENVIGTLESVLE